MKTDRTYAHFLLSWLCCVLVGSNALGYEEIHNNQAPSYKAAVSSVSSSSGHCNTTVPVYEDITTPAVTDSNYGRPLTCWYQIRGSETQTSEYVVDIRFKRFNVGRVINESNCEGGYMQIIDGTSSNDITNDQSPGYICEEMQTDRNFISETNNVKVIFHADSFTENTYMTFFTRTELKRSLHDRYGDHVEMFGEDRRGKPVGVDTYCERVFSDCRADNCIIQSPGYPGPYLRDLHCRYHLSVQGTFVRVLSEGSSISVDGQRCDSALVCPLRYLSSDDRICTRDWISIYDGKSELSTKIATFCGYGTLPYSVTGSSSDMLVVFRSSRAGSLLNTGFQLPVTSVTSPPTSQQGRKQGRCDWLFSARRMRRAGHLGGQFGSLPHWYPANITCKYVIRAEAGHKVRLSFTRFRVKPTIAPLADESENCVESLSVFDGATSSSGRLVRLFCNSFSAPADNEVIYSSGRVIMVVFNSRSGSFEASSLFYRARFDFYRDAWYGQHVDDTWCDEVLTPGASSHVFGSPINRLKLARSDGGDTHCRYKLQASARHYRRLLVNITAVDFASATCPAATTTTACFQTNSHVISSSDKQRVCVCRADQLPITVLTHLPNLTLHMSVNHKAGKQLMNAGKPVFQGEYFFVNNPYCGDPFPRSDTFGYPALEYSPNQATYCIWTLEPEPGADLWFRVDQLSLPTGACRLNRLRVFVGERWRLWRDICTADAGSSHVVPSDSLDHSRRVQLHLQSSSAGARLQVRWSSLASVITAALSARDSVVAPVTNSTTPATTLHHPASTRTDP